MRQNEQEIQLLKDEINKMWKLVISQLEKAKRAFLNYDVETALEVVSMEKRVNAFELKIENNCENYIALYSPVAIDLRLVLSILKISISLERIGDYADGVAKHVIDMDCNHLDPKLTDELELEKMFDLLLRMMSDSMVMFNSESTKSAGKILIKDKEINKIYGAAFEKLEEYMIQKPKDIHCGLKLILIIRKMERIGDHCSNIVEEIVFYIEAKVLKHKKRIDKK